MEESLKDKQIRSIVRVGMKYGDGWALYGIAKIQYSGGMLVTLEFRTFEPVDYIRKIVHIYPDGFIRTEGENL